MIVFDAGDLIDGRYEVLDEFGRGGMGVVLRVLDREEGEEVALKYCPATEEIARRRFGREVRIMAAITHPNVMPVLAQSDSYDPPYFTMPIAMGSVRDSVHNGLALDDALDIFKSICLGVQAIHGAGSTHRDLKPDNAIRMDDERIVIADLGLARLADRDTTTLTQTAAFLGTRMYCAPEQLLMGGSRTADERTDIFQLGKVLYELVTGDQPAVIDSALIPAGLEHVIDRATQQHPDRRYQTVGQLMDAVENFVRAQDPNASAHGEFDAALEQAEGLLAQDKYSSENLEKILELIGQFVDDDDYYIEQFERISSRLIGIMARMNPELLVRPLEKYCDAVENVIGGYNFAHAEIVAKKMKAAFDAGESPAIKVLAIKATMIAAVKLNRFAAMEVYDGLLKEITTAEVAAPVAEMLRENVYYYRRLAGRVPAARLHAAIRQIPTDDE